MEQLNWDSVVRNPRLPLLWQPRQAEQVRFSVPVRRVQSSLQQRGGFAPDEVDRIPQAPAGHAPDDFDGPLGIPSVD